MNDLVYINHDQPRTNTLRVADKFGKRHDNVLRDVANLECSNEFRLLNFEESSYLNQQGKQQPLFELTRDGFMFLVMGFTGREAARWKEAFLAAFNAMETNLRALAPGGFAPPVPATAYPAVGSPFDNVQAAKLGKLLRINKSSALAYLIACGVTPEYVQAVLARHGALPAFPMVSDITGQAAPLDHLAFEIPLQADREDEMCWYCLRETFARVCGDYDVTATAKNLRALGYLRINKFQGLTFRATPKLFPQGRPHVFAIRKSLAVAAGGDHA